MASLIESVLRRERVIVLLCLAGIVVLAWLYLFDMAGHMAMGHLMSPIDRPWRGADFVAAGLMWAIMMAGMMLPSAAPVVLLYLLVDAQARGGGDSVPESRGALLLAGYLAAWTLFSLAATVGQWQSAERALLDSGLGLASQTLGGAVLVLAGLYEWSPLKQRCLRHCRSPLAYVTQHYRGGAIGAFRMGAAHGIYCVGCCWALMLALFVVGVMNLAWVAGLAALTIAQKYWRHGRILSLASGALFVLAGGLMIARQI